jgi:O-antigen/teichoic acid export membrane protein
MEAMEATEAMDVEHEVSTSANGNVCLADETPVEAAIPATFRADSLLSAMTLMLVLAVVQRGTGFLRNVLVCRFLEPSELGYWNLANSFLILAAPLIVLGIPGTFKRYVAHYEQRGMLRGFLVRTTRVTCGLTVAGVVLMLMCRQQVAWLAFGDAQSTRLVGLVAATLLAVIAFNFCMELLTALRQVRFVSYLQLANSVLFTLVSLALIGWFGWAAEGVIVGYAVACLVTAMFALHQIVIGLRSRLASELPQTASRIPLWERLVPVAFWFWMADLLANLFGLTDRLMIVHLADGLEGSPMTMIGQYHSSQIIGTLLLALTAMLSGILLSYVSHDWEVGERVKAARTLDRSLKLISLCMTWCAAIGLLVAPLVFSWALENKYRDGLDVLPMTMAYCIWCGLWSVAHNYLWCRERAWVISATVLVGLVVNTLLNFWWLPVWGLSGAVAATAVANLVTLFLVMWICHLMGMRYAPSTWLAMAAPAILCTGGPIAVVVTTSWIVVGVFGGWLLDEQQRSRLMRMGRSLREEPV